MTIEKDFFNLDNPDEGSSKIITDQHAIWKNVELQNIKEYYMLFNGISAYLPYMKSATNLYLFYCLAAKNKTGESWYSIDTLADILQVSSRTINTWNDRLRLLHLIKRQQGVRKSAHTFLLPTRDYVVNGYSGPFMKKSLNMDELLEKIKKIYDFLDCTDCNIFHLFQWRKGKESKKADALYNVPYNSLVISLSRKCNIYMRENFENDLDGKKDFEEATTRRIFIYVELPKDDPDFVEIEDTPSDFLNNNVSFEEFKSPFSLERFKKVLEKKKSVTGIAISTQRDLTDYSSNDRCSKDDIDFLTELDSRLDEIKSKLGKVKLKNDKGK